MVRNNRILLTAILLVAGCLPLGARLAQADAGPLLKLLQSGRLPAERRPTVVEMVCQRGNADDLAYVFGQVLDPKTYPAELRLKVLGWLADASRLNKVRPAGDLSEVKRLLADDQARSDPAFALAAIRLAAQWRVPDIAEPLRQLALADPPNEKTLAEVIRALTALGGDSSRSALEQLAGPGRPVPIRFQAAQALTGFDVDAAARLAAAALAAATPKDDSAALIQPFLERKQGSDKLAAALGAVELKTDVAKLALRAMYTAGHSDPALSDALSKAAGVERDIPAPTAQQVAALVAEMQAKGDAARGELVFRRSDVNCMKCHTVSGGGGDIGPDLSPVGAASPADHVVKSILDPNDSIKEAYQTKKLVTSQGQLFVGIVVDRNPQRVKLKDALGKIIEIPVADIEEEIDGQSMMPQGLVKFLTHDEFLDLAKFISALGDPKGPFPIRSKPTVQRWRVMADPDALGGQVLNLELLRQHVFAAPGEAWLPAFGKAAGALPLNDLAVPADKSVVYLQGTVDVVEPGDVGVEVHSSVPLTAWIDANEFDPRTRFVTPLTKGQHTLTLRVVRPAPPTGELSAEFFVPEGAKTQLRAK